MLQLLKMNARAARTRLTAVAIALCFAGVGSASAQGAAWQNESLPLEARAKDLVSKMTLEEKVSQMKDVAPGIDRLGIPAYNWWNEALHGVARSGLATVFPQAIGMAATWNTSLMLQMATVVSDEGRAKYHDYVRNNSRARYQGLTFWSPNINIFRDPRWGRGQETYGEDPFLTGTLGVQFIRGLQGDDPKYFKTIATVKHFAVHSGPESDRHVFNAVVSERDMRETYLPHFEMGIREGGAYSLMCAYNRIAGSPACASDFLLKDVLRGEWGFKGYVVSDCGAIDDIYLRHKVVATAPEAAASAVKTGTDLDCGRVYPNLVDAVAKGFITEAQIDTSITRLFLGRFKLGLFDAPDHVRWASTPISDLDSPAHKQLARKAARESIVLLKNAGSLLPLKQTLGTIAVIGPNADQARMLLGNYNGEPSDAVTPLRGIREAVRATKVVYAPGSDLAEGFPVTQVVPASLLTSPDGQRGARAEFFSGKAFDVAPLFTRVDSVVSGNWALGSPRADLGADDFSVRWTSVLTPSRSGLYTVGLSGTMKFRLLIDDTVMVRSISPRTNDEYGEARAAMTRPMQLEGGRHYRISVEGTETTGDAQLEMLWTTPSDSLEDEAVRAAQSADAVILVLGLSARLEGEEMPVQIPGFKGGDRTSLDLPAPQQHLLERIAALGKPTVLVLLNGSALSVNWANDRVPAIVEAWYGGQAAGSAIADVIFGDYNPAGRLPVTFYKSVDDLPPFDDYNMAGHTYRYFTGTPLYAFGHGLSYSTFQYSNLRVPAVAAGAAKPAIVSVDVMNTSTRAGDEVVQLYVRHPDSKVSRPVRELKGFTRISLKPGETRRVDLPLPRKALTYWDDTAHAWAVEGGKAVVEIGASSADIRLTQTITVRAGKP